MSQEVVAFRTGQLFPNPSRPLALHLASSSGALRHGSPACVGGALAGTPLLEPLSRWLRALQVPAQSPTPSLGALWKWGGFCACNCPATTSTSGQLRFCLSKSRAHPTGREEWAPVTESRPAAGGRWGAGRRCLQSGGNSSSGTGTNTELSLQKGFCVSAQPHRVLGRRYELLKALGFPIGLRGDKRVSAVCN